MNAVRGSFVLFVCAILASACGPIPSQGADQGPQQTLVAQATINATGSHNAQEQVKTAPTSVPSDTPVPPTATATLAPSPTSTRTPTTRPSPTLTPPPTSLPRRLSSSGMVRTDPRGPQGGYTLSITDTATLDSVVAMVENDRATGKDVVRVAAYIRSGENYEIQSLGTALYACYVVFGEDWDADALKFTRKTEYHRVAQPMNMGLDTSARVYYTWWIRLASGPSSFAPIIPAEQFPSLKY